MQYLTVWRGDYIIPNMPLNELLPTDKLQDANNHGWYPATDWYVWAPPPPQASFEVCYGKTCARATGPGPAIFGAALPGLVIGVALGVKLA